jgi:hypothetical protein
MRPTPNKQVLDRVGQPLPIFGSMAAVTDRFGRFGRAVIEGVFDAPPASAGIAVAVGSDRGADAMLGHFLGVHLRNGSLGIKIADSPVLPPRRRAAGGPMTGNSGGPMTMANPTQTGPMTVAGDSPCPVPFPPDLPPAVYAAACAHG